MSGDHTARLVAGGAAGFAVVGVGVAAVAKAQPTVLSVAITVAGAIIVALITWFATDRRLGKDLQAQSDRMAWQLAHERARDERQHLLAFLDEAAATFETVLEITLRFQIQRNNYFDTAGSETDDEQQIVERLKMQAEATETFVEGQGLTLTFGVTLRRMPFRLDETGPIFTLYRDMYNIFHDIYSRPHGLDEAENPGDIHALGNALALYKTFAQASREYLAQPVK